MTMAHYWILVIGAFAVFLEARPFHQQRSSVLSAEEVYSGNATYYDPSVGACGMVSDGEELVVAIADSLYETKTIDGNPNHNEFCGRHISVRGPNGTAVVTVVDRCGSCKGGDLDLSRPAFDQIGDPIDGHVPITWQFA